MKYTKRGSGPLSLPPRNTCDAQGNPARPPGIEGVEMRKVYYNLMRRAALEFPWLRLVFLAHFPAPSRLPCEPPPSGCTKAPPYPPPRGPLLPSTKRKFSKTHHTEPGAL